MNLLALQNQRWYDDLKSTTRNYLQNSKKSATLLRKSSCFKAGILLHSILVLLLQSGLGKDYGLCARAISESAALQKRFRCCGHPKENPPKICCKELHKTLDGFNAFNVIFPKSKSTLPASECLSWCFILWCCQVCVFHSSCPLLPVKSAAGHCRWGGVPAPLPQPKHQGIWTNIFKKEKSWVKITAWRQVSLHLFVLGK